MSPALDYRPPILPPDAEEVTRGLWRWAVPGGVVLCPSVQADPLKDSTDWWDASREGMPTAEHAREYGIDFSVFTGKPVFPDYRDHLHRSPVPLPYVPTRPILRGWDIPGPLACVWLQLNPVKLPGAAKSDAARLRCSVLAELYADCGVEEFGRQVLSMSAVLFPGASQYLDYADPAAWAEIGHDKRSAHDILRSRCQITLRKGATDLTARLEAVRAWLTRMVPMSGPHEPAGALLLDPSCVILRDGFKSGYHYREVESSGRFQEIPAKNDFSHVADALQYPLTRVGLIETPESEREAEPLVFTSYLGGLRR